jgi:hypothetical protein
MEPDGTGLASRLVFSFDLVSLSSYDPQAFPKAFNLSVQLSQSFSLRVRVHVYTF